MDGYRLVFSTIRGRKHNKMQLHDWLISEAKNIGISGVTVIDAMEGYGRHQDVHSSNFFELAEEPVEIVMLADEEQCRRLFELIKEQKVSIFYAKTKAEYGFTI